MESIVEMQSVLKRLRAEEAEASRRVRVISRAMQELNGTKTELVKKPKRPASHGPGPEGRAKLSRMMKERWAASRRAMGSRDEQPREEPSDD